MKQGLLRACLGALLALALVVSLQAAEELGPRPKAWSLLRNQVELMQVKKYANASEKAWRAYEIFEDLGDLTGQAYCLTLIGSHHALTQNLDEANTHLEKAQSLLLIAGQPLWSAAVAHLRGRVLRSRSNLEESARTFHTGLTLIKSLRDTMRPLELRGADLYAAFLSLPSEFPISSNASRPEDRAWILSRAEASFHKDIGRSEIVRGRFPEAERHLSKALAMAGSIDDKERSEILSVLADLKERRGEAEEFWSIYGAAIAALGPGLERVKAGLIEALLGHTFHEGALNATLGQTDRLLEAARDRRDWVSEAMLLRNRSILLKRLGKTAGALET